MCSYHHVTTIVEDNYEKKIIIKPVQITNTVRGVFFTMDPSCPLATGWHGDIFVGESISFRADALVNVSEVRMAYDRFGVGLRDNGKTLAVLNRTEMILYVDACIEARSRRFKMDTPFSNNDTDDGAKADAPTTTDVDGFAAHKTE